MGYFNKILRKRGKDRDAMIPMSEGDRSVSEVREEEEHSKDQGGSETKSLELLSIGEERRTTLGSGELNVDGALDSLETLAMVDRLSTATKYKIIKDKMMERVWNNVLPCAIVLMMVFSNSLMQQGLHEVVKEFQVVCGAADVHIAWAGEVSLGMGSAINETRSVVGQIDDYERMLKRKFDDVVFSFSECKDISRFNTVNERVEYLELTREKLSNFKEFVDDYVEAPFRYVEVFESACLTLPAVLRNSPFFETPNSLCVGNHFVRDLLVKLQRGANDTSTKGLEKLDAELEKWATMSVVPSEELCVQLEFDAENSGVNMESEELQKTLSDFLDKIHEAVGYLDSLTVSFSATSSFNDTFTEANIFGLTLAVFMVATLLDMAVIFLPKPSNTKVQLGKRRLVVNVVEAGGLIAKDITGFSDPYCVITTYPPPLVTLANGKKIFSEPKKKKTKVVYNSLNPVYKQFFTFFLEGHEKQVRVEIYDKDILSRDDYMGEVRVGLKDVTTVPTPTYVWNELVNYDHPNEKVSGALKVRCHYVEPWLSEETSVIMRENLQAIMDFLTSSVLRRVVHLLAICFNIFIVGVGVAFVLLSSITLVFPHYYLCVGVETVVSSIFGLIFNLVIEGIDLASQFFPPSTIERTMSLERPAFECDVFRTVEFTAASKFFLWGSVLAVIVQFNVFALLAHKYGKPKAIFKKKQGRREKIKEETVEKFVEETIKVSESIAEEERSSFFQTASERPPPKTAVSAVRKALNCACGLVCFPCKVLSLVLVYFCRLCRGVVKYSWRIIRLALKYGRLAAYYFVCCPFIFVAWIKKVDDPERIARHPKFYTLVRFARAYSGAIFTFALLVVGNSLLTDGLGRTVDDFRKAFAPGTPYIEWVGNVSVDFRNSTDFLKEKVVEVSNYDEELRGVIDGVFDVTSDKCDDAEDFIDGLTDKLEDVKVFALDKTQGTIEFLDIIVDACHELVGRIDPVLFSSPWFSVPNQICDGGEYVLGWVKKGVGVVDESVGTGLVMLNAGDACEDVVEFLKSAPLCVYLDMAGDGLDIAAAKVIEILDGVESYLDLVGRTSSWGGETVEVAMDVDVFGYLISLFAVCQALTGILLFSPSVSQERNPHGRERIVVEIGKGKDLAAKDLPGRRGGKASSDPYVVVTSGKNKFRTKWKSKDLNPDFGTVFKWLKDGEATNLAEEGGEGGVAGATKGKTKERTKERTKSSLQIEGDGDEETRHYFDKMMDRASEGKKIHEGEVVGGSGGSEDFIIVQVFDHDFIGVDEFMGQIVLNVAELGYDSSKEMIEYDLKRSSKYPKEFVHGSLELRAYRMEKFRWLECCRRRCVGDKTEDCFDRTIRGLLLTLYKTLQKSIIHYGFFVLNVVLLSLYLGLLIFSAGILYLPWETFCQTSEDGVSGAFKLVELMIDKGSELANELLGVGSIEATLGLKNPQLRCSYLGSEEHMEGVKIVMLGLTFCCLAQYHVFGVISHKYQVLSSLHYKRRAERSKDGEDDGQGGEEGAGQTNPMIITGRRKSGSDVVREATFAHKGLADALLQQKDRDSNVTGEASAAKQRNAFRAHAESSVSEM